MEQHREVSRGGGESSVQQTAALLVGPGRQASEFVGYTKTSVLTAVVESGPVDGHASF